MSKPLPFVIPPQKKSCSNSLRPHTPSSRSPSNALNGPTGSPTLASTTALLSLVSSLQVIALKHPAALVVVARMVTRLRDRLESAEHEAHG
jgi:hypothetical protein